MRRSRCLHRDRRPQLDEGRRVERQDLAAVRALGAEHFFVLERRRSVGELNRTDTLAIAAKALRAAGASDADLTVMFKDNPAYLVKLPKLGGAAPRAR